LGIDGSGTGMGRKFNEVEMFGSHPEQGEWGHVVKFDDDVKPGADGDVECIPKFRFDEPS